MSRPLARALLLALSCTAFAGLRAQDAAPVPDLSLDQAVARAMQKNFDLKIESFSTEIAKESFNAADTLFEPTFIAGTTRTVVQGDPAVGSGQKTDFTDSRLGVQQLISTGASVNLSTSLDRNAYNPGTGLSLNPSFNSDVSLNIVQPLLRGAGSTVTKATLERTRIGVTIAGLSYKGRVLQVIRDTEAAYYNLIFARGQLAVKEKSQQLAEQLLEENKTRKLTGVATDLDVLSAEVGVANARNGVLLAHQAVRNSEDALTALIGQFEFSTPVGAVALPADTEAVPTFDRSYQLARDNQPDYVATQHSIRQLEIDAATAKNGALPTLNLGGTVGYNGTDRTYGKAIGNVPNGDAYNWQLDLSLSVPWGLHADKARYRSAMASLRQQQTRLQQIEQNLLVNVRTAVRAVDTNRQSVEIVAKATELAQRQYELELARFKAGLSTSRQVLQTQDDLETARVNELQAIVNLRTAVANLHQLDSTSIARFHVAVQ
ncbi:MAG: TolC family protein [Verrucomicrobia bacterium]|nr:TolC family protein [Verrucomicrobiota bacterium]